MSSKTNDIDLGGQVAIVTGGGRGIGRAMAQALAAAKAKVAVVARSEAQLNETVDLIRKDGGRVLAFPADVTDRIAIEKMVETVQRELGAVDILVNNAGVAGEPELMWNRDPEEARRIFDVNLYGPYLCSVTVLKQMIERHRGYIINVASGAALHPGKATSAYAVSKAALLRLTECIAVEGEAEGIVAFAIDPGPVRTAMAEQVIASEGAKIYLPEFRQIILSGAGIPPEVSARLVVLLASGQLDALSGRFIDVSDDIDQLLLHAEKIQQDDLYTLRLRKLQSIR